MDELIEVLDEKGNKTGQVKAKREIKKDGNYHRAIAVLIISDNKILLQKRNSTKKVYPNLWSLFVKGHVQAGETSIEASIREINEEIGITIKENELTYLYTIKEETNNQCYMENIFYDTYILRKKIKLDDIVIQEDEVSEVKYMDINDVYNSIQNNSELFVPNKEDYKRIFEYLKS